MKDGCIVEEGDHRLLMSNINGEYANLIKSFHDDGDTQDGGDTGICIVWMYLYTSCRISK